MNFPPLQNPWRFLLPAQPHVLAEDAPAINAFNARAATNKQYDLSLFPEPFFGSNLAPVLLLALNPGWSPNDGAVHGQPWFAEQSRRSLAHELQPYPFLHLQPGSSTPGSLWWQRITGTLIGAVGFEAVAKNLSCVQFFPYHSLEFGSARLTVPSQQYGFHLVRSAIQRGAEIVVMRSWRLWSEAVPELSAYPRVHFVRNPRNPSLSPKNLANGFNAVLARLDAGT
jgi:hypothetical protein